MKIYKMEIYKRLVKVATVLNNPKASATDVDHQSQMLDKLVKLAPSGHGYDRGTEFVTVASNERRLVFRTAIHHMDSDGRYTEWTEHEVIVTADLLTDFYIKVTGPKKGFTHHHIISDFTTYLRYMYEE